MKYKQLLLLSIFLFLVTCSSLLAQPVSAGTDFPVYGVPGITHYTREDFNADPQFWSVCEDKEGLLYFGNNDGALVFDGERWHKVYLPNNSAVRSLTTDHAGRVWAGGYNEIGLIGKDRWGQYQYTSMLDSLKLNDKNLENLWQVHSLQETVIFRSFQKLIAIKGNKVTELPASSTFSQSYLLHDQLYVLDREQGILLLDAEKMQFLKLFDSSSFAGDHLVSLLPGKAPHLLIGVAQSGKIYQLDRKNGTVQLWQNLFANSTTDQIINGIKSSDGLYYLGTLSSRIISMSEDGRVFWDEHNFERLQDKTVLNLFETSQGTIWALLNRGLDCIDFNSPVTTLFNNASIYDVLINADKMYLATNQGVFWAQLVRNELNMSRLHFEKIKGLEGQAWSLQLLEGDVVGGHDRGLFSLNAGNSQEIGELDGVWKIIPAAGHPGLYLACSYNGLYAVARSPQGAWKVLRKIRGFNESSRDILAADSPGTYWVCHGYKGVYRIQLDGSLSQVSAVEHYTTQNGLPSPFNINVFRWEGQTVFTTNEGVYVYQAATNQFVPFAPLNAVLDPKVNTRKLLQYRELTWFVQDDEAGYFQTNNGSPTLQKELFLQFKGSFNRGMECIVPLDERRVLFGTNAGLHLFDFSNQAPKKEVPTLLSSVRYTVNQEEQQLPLHPGGEAGGQLPHTTSGLRFEFAAPAMQSGANVQYSYQLEPLEDSWSAWKSTPYKEFSHLRPGRYTFKVRSRNLLGMSGTETSYPFEILPIWYNTPWAWSLYLIGAALLMVLLVYFISRKITQENNKTRQEEQKARKLLELELEQMKLNREKERIRQEKELLEEDVLYKSKELANYTMLLVKKREVFAELIQDLKALRELSKNEASRSNLREIIKKISSHLSDEEYLQVFDTNFEKIHHEFFTTLKELYPDLNQRDLRLCAFVKMNLSNKEISPLLNISVRGVETARYRIRKKLNIDPEHNMVEFLEKLSPASEEPHSVEE